MGWSIGYSVIWNRDIGYGVPALCDHPDCDKGIHRGLAYVCGGESDGGAAGCGLHFCSHHLRHTRVGQLCERCYAAYGSRSFAQTFEPKPDIPRWLRFKLSDASWAEWRAANPQQVAAARLLLAQWRCVLKARQLLRHPAHK